MPPQMLRFTEAQKSETFRILTCGPGSETVTFFNVFADTSATQERKLQVSPDERQKFLNDKNSVKALDMLM